MRPGPVCRSLSLRLLRQFGGFIREVQVLSAGLQGAKYGVQLRLGGEAVEHGSGQNDRGEAP